MQNFNLDERSHSIEKMRKSAEKVEFEDDRHLELIMKLVHQVHEAVSLIKVKYGLVYQRETKVQNFEEENHRSESC